VIPTGTAYAQFPLDPKPPAFVPRLVQWRHHETMDEGKTYRFRVFAYLDVSGPNGEGSGLNRAQTQLDDYLSDDGANSISQALEADSTLGGVIDDLMVIGGNDYGMVEVGGGQMLAGAVEVDILA
jgi:hypothetical protein